jgi:cytochrome d ubiquinol oxidase subunit I
MGDSLAFHIIFVMFGLTLPVLVVWFEWWGLHRKDKKSVDTAYFWSKIMALLVITGVISGTVIALQMSLVWPGILKFGGEVIGLPFMFETYAFLIEAVFLALYMATWHNKKLPRAAHIFFGFMVIVGATLSAYAITAINGWMNLPTGFTIVQGKFQNVDVWQALFSRTAIIEFIHSMPAYYLAASMLIATLYLFKLLRARPKERLGAKHKFDWVIVQRLLLFAAGAMVALVITADITGKYLAKYEPVKMAAIEMTNNTGSNLPFIFGGVPGADGKIAGPYFIIPNALSILVGSSSNTVVKGINDYPVAQRPPSYVRALFNIKLTLIGVLVAGFVVYFALRVWRPKFLAKSIVLLPLALVGILGIIIVELGWMLTEIGRQPWAVTGYVTTEQAVTKTNNITSFGYIFPAAFLLLLAVTIMAVRKIIVDNAKSGKEAK